MKKGLRLLSLYAILIITSQAFSQNALTIGGSYWKATPDINLAGSDATISGGHFYGPYANLRFGKVLLGGSLFLGSYQMEEEAGNYYDDYGNLLPYDINFDTKRTDINGTLGFSIVRGISLFAAIKSLNNTFEYADPIMSLTWSAKGIFYGGGISGVLNISNSPVFLFASIAYLTGKVKMELEEFDATEEFDQNMASLTLGGGFRISPNLHILVGYRSDAMGEGDEEEYYDKFRGVTASLGYVIPLAQ